MADGRPRVYLLTWDYPPSMGGIQRWMYELARRLPDVELTTFAPATNGGRAFDAAATIRVRRVRGARRGPVPWVVFLTLRVLAVSLVRRPALIVCGHVVAAPAALLLRAVLRIPYIVFVHGVEIRGRRWRRVIRYGLRRADIIVANSAFTRTLVLKYGVDRHRVRIVYPGVDTALFADRGFARSKEEHTILSVSRLDEHYKGHDRVLRALPLVQARFPNVRYVIAGSGALSDYLRRMAQALGVGDVVEFRGEVSDKVLISLYSECDVFVQLSREAPNGGVEGFGIVCLEAAAAAKPVVAGRSGGLPDAVRDGETGLLVDPEDTLAVADAIVSLLENPARAVDLGRQGRMRVEREFTWDGMGRRVRALIAELLREDTAPHACVSSS
jgi:phosphatidylinositol alpha-1,6-mannosyltransferase